MDSFVLLNNKYISDIDSASKRDYQFDEYNLKNTLKIARGLPGRQTNTATVSNTVYGAEYTFDFDTVMKHNGLSEMFLQIYNLTYTDNTFTDTWPDFADTFISEVTLRAKSGTTLMHYTANQSKKRIEEAMGFPLKDYYDDCIQIVNGSDTSCYLPIFSWITTKSPLNLRYCEPLELVIKIADISGLYSTEVTGVSFNLVCIFHDFIEMEKPLLQNGYDVHYSSAESKLNSYDIFMEPVQSYTVVNNDLNANYTFKLSCPYPSYVMHVAAMSNKKTFYPINGINLINNNAVFFSLPSYINFQIGNTDELGSIEFNTHSHWFSKEQCRYNATGLLEFGDSFNQTFLNIQFDENTSGSDVAVSIYVWFEYKTDIMLKDNKFVKESTGLFKGPFAGPGLQNIINGI